MWSEKIRAKTIVRWIAGCLAGANSGSREVEEVHLLLLILFGRKNFGNDNRNEKYKSKSEPPGRYRSHNLKA